MKGAGVMNPCLPTMWKNASRWRLFGVRICVALNSLRLFEELELTGGVLRVDGEVVAFTIGEPLCGDTFVVHIEKALSRVPEAYAMINQQFVCHSCMDYRYVNREEDTGAEGLRIYGGKRICDRMQGLTCKNCIAVAGFCIKHKHN